MSDGPFPTVELSDPRYERDGIRHSTVFSPALGHRADCTFWLPVDRTTRCRLVVLLHGVYASHWGWSVSGGAHTVAEALATSGDVAPFALAMPSDGLYRHGSGYVTTQAGDVERWIVEEVPALAALAAVPIDPAAQLSIVGLSMGGFGALSIGAWNADRVESVVGMSSITDFDEMQLFVGDLGDYAIEPRRRRVLDSILANRDHLPRIRFDCGSDDPLIDGNRRLHTELDAAGVAHEWAEYGGGHEWAYWHAHLGEAIRFCVGTAGA